MTWFKKIFFLLPIVTIIIELFFFNSQKQQTNLNPLLVDQQQRITKLESELRLSLIEPINIEYFNYRQEAEFKINYDNQTIKVVVSLKKDTFSQVAALQKILKKANIKKDIKFIDLSSDPAYATFQNI